MEEVVSQRKETDEEVEVIIGSEEQCKGGTGITKARQVYSYNTFQHFFFFCINHRRHCGFDASAEKINRK